MNGAALIDFFLLSAVWGASFLFMRVAVVEFGAMPTAGLRVGVAALALLPLVLWRGLGPQLRRHWKPIFTFGALNSGLPFALYCFALLHITTGLSAILNATVPMFGALVAWLWLKDRPSGSRILGLTIGFGGVALLAWDKASLKTGTSEADAGWSVGACLLACFFYGISANAAKRYLAGIPALVTATGSQLGASLVLAIPAIWLWPAQVPSLKAWGGVVAVGVLCTGLAYVLYFRLIERVGPARSLAVTFVVPVFAVIYGLIFLGEPVTRWMLLSGAVIVLGTALSTGLINFSGKSVSKPA